MGAWATGLFSDDTACDVRDGYRELVADGLSSPEATDHLVAEWADQLSDPDVGPVFWLALAATQWRCGRLEARVKKRAIGIINDGTDLARWQGVDLVRKRSGVLSRLKKQLETPQPPEKRIQKRFKDHTEWETGDVVSYRLQSGQLALFRVIGYNTDRGGKSPICELLDWSGKSTPEENVIGQLGFRRGEGNWQDVTQFMVGRLKETELPKDRVEVVMRQTKPYQKPGSCMIFLWTNLDNDLDKFFGLS